MRALTIDATAEAQVVNRWKKARSSRAAGVLLLLAGAAPSCGEASLVYSVSRETNAPDPDAGAATSEVSEPRTAPDSQGLVTGDSEFDAAAASTSAATTEPTETEWELVLDGTPIYSDYVRLTHLQWENSVVANLRLESPTGHSESLPADSLSPSRYSNNEQRLLVADELLAAYQAAAADIAARATVDAVALGRVSTSSQPETFIAEVGRRFYRRPLSAEETATYLDLFDTGASLAGPGETAFAAGARMLIEVWLQAPTFLYRVAHSEAQLDGYELATRLALLLTDVTPTDALLDAAAAGKLDTRDGVTEIVEELLATPEAAQVFARFHEETFQLRGLPEVQFAESFALPTTLGASLSKSAQLFFSHQFREGTGLRELLTSDAAFVDADLAGFYDLAAPTTEFEQVLLPDSRRGMFAQLPFLMLDSLNETPNAFRRGAMIAKNLLCQTMVPPPTVSPTPPLPEPGLTNRERSSQMVAGPDCADCHASMDPYGFAFENFDGLGRERNEDNGLPVDTTGVYPLARDVTFRDSTELMALLAESQRAHDCYALHLTEFSLGRELSAPDAPLVEDLGALSHEQNQSLAKLVTALVTGETFRSAGVPQ